MQGTTPVAQYKTISAFVTFETDESFELAMKWEKIEKFRKQLGERTFREEGEPFRVHLEEAPEVSFNGRILISY